MPQSYRPKLERARDIIREAAPVVVAFSGGVDSTLVLKLAVDAVGSRSVLAATGISPSIPPEEQNAAQEIARTLGAPFLPIRTFEIENENYVKNPKNRCFFCKEELFTRLRAVLAEKQFKTLLDGTNADDANDWRPGKEAARKFGVRSPLREADLSKEEIRDIAKELGLPNWDKPAMPCLSSRVPYGEPITIERLYRIHQAENTLRRRGFSDVRVRDHFPVARIEVPLPDLPRLLTEPLRSEVLDEVKKAGYAFVTLDMAGLRSGSLNQVKE